MWTSCCLCDRGGARLCADCRARFALPRAGFLGTASPIAAFAYEGAARDLVLGLKLRARRPHADPLVAGMVAAVYRRGLLGDLLTWVPGRREDIRRRGYDHAALLARRLADELGLPCRSLLTRTRAISDQSALEREQRRHNVAAAFAARPCSGAVVLVDDVMTTGATAEACSAALRESGACSVEVVVAARA